MTVIYQLFTCGLKKKMHIFLPDWLRCLLIDLLTGAVGSPLPEVEVQIVMSNSTNTTIVEGNHSWTWVTHKYIPYELTYSQEVVSRQQSKDSVIFCLCLKCNFRFFVCLQMRLIISLTNDKSQFCLHLPPSFRMASDLNTAEHSADNYIVKSLNVTVLNPTDGIWWEFLRLNIDNDAFLKLICD